MSDTTPSPLGEMNTSLVTGQTLQPSRQLELNPNVAKVSTGLYLAGAKTTLTADERNLIEGWATIKSTHEKLMRMSNSEAERNFNLLSKDDQSVLKAYYNVDYANKPTDGALIQNTEMRKILGLDDGLSVGDVVKSPMRFLMQGAEQYGKAFNTLPSMLQNSVINHQKMWTRNNGDMAFDGKRLYDNNEFDKLSNKYGAESAFVAQEILAGATPGEIIDSWGPNDPAILVAINGMFSAPDKFQSMLDEFDRARLSPGRDIARWVDKKLNIDPNKESTLFKFGSGSIDLAFQIFADPLTYLTMGGSSVIKSGAFNSAKLAEALTSGSRTAVEHLSLDKVGKYFEGYTKGIAEYRTALEAGDDIKAAEIVDGLRKTHKAHATDEEIGFWTKADNGSIKDLNSFKDYFNRLGEKEGSVSRLVRGLEVGNAYAREGAAYARTSRNITMAAKQKATELLTGKKSFADLDKADVQVMFDEMKKAAPDFSVVEHAIPVVDSKKINSIQKWIERQSSIHPGSRTVYVDDNRVFDSLDTVRRQAYLATNDKALAEVFTQHFATAAKSERIALKRSLDELSMRRAGVHGTDGGEDFIKSQLDIHYGSDKSFSSSSKLTFPDHFPSVKHGINEVEIQGPLHSYQFKDGIGALDWKAISEHLASSQIANKNIFKFIGGLFNNKLVNNITNTWSALTLLPRLGVRTAIDEGFMAGLYASGSMAKDLLHAKSMGNVLTAYTQDLAATGPLKNAMQIALGRIVGKDIGAVRTIGESTRKVIREKHYAQIGKNPKYVDAYYAEQEARKELFNMAIKARGKRLPEEYQNWLREAIELNPTMLRETSSSSIAHALMQTQDVWKTDRILGESAMDTFLRENKVDFDGVFKDVDVRDFTNHNLQKAMYRNFYTRFAGTPFKIGKQFNSKIDMSRLFIKHNGLKTEADVVRATNEFLDGIGFIRNADGTFGLVPSKVKDVENFISQTRQMDKWKGLPYDQVLGRFAQEAFADLYHTFHGGHGQFNQKLLDIFQDTTPGYIKNVRSVIDKLSFDDYRALTKDNLAKDRIITDMEDISRAKGLTGVISKFGDLNKGFEWMSRQTDDIMRQPVVHATYIFMRKSNQVFEKQMAKALADSRFAEKAATGAVFSDAEKADVIKKANEQAARYFAELSMNQAAHHVLKYVDNPEVRTIFAHNVRNVGRFYRATEDFARRMTRLMQDHGLGTVHRMRLMNQGLSAIGDVHVDENGDQYVVLPMENTIFSLVDKNLRKLTNNEASVTQPLFNNLTFKLTAGNPSFQTEAGMPYLSGPAGGLSVLAVKGLLGKFDATRQMSENVDNLLMGSMGDNITFSKAITPALVNNVWNLFNPDEKSQQEVSALTQAMAYNEANGTGGVPDLSDPKYKNADGTLNNTLYEEDKTAYLKNLRISTHNIIALRILLGNALPFSVQMKDTKDVPKFLQHNGVTSMKASFYELKDQITAKYPDIQDPYEMTLATWMGQNPGQIAYLVNAKSKDVKPYLKYGKDMQNWVIKNQDSIDQYGNGALLFAPNTDKFNPGVWKWAEAAGLVKNTDISKYYDALLLQEHVNAYYDLNKQEEEALRNTSFALTDQRQAINKKFELERKTLKYSVPGLANYIKSGINNADVESFVESAHAYVNSDKPDVSTKTIDLVNQMYDLYNNFMNYALQVNNMNLSNASDIKLAEKDRTVAEMEKLIKQDTTGALQQYYKNGVLRLMTSISRDAQATVNRNVAR